MSLLLKTFLSLLFIGGFLLFPYSNVSASAGFGNITGGVVLHRADGTVVDLPGVTITVESTRDNNYKWQSSTGECFGCQTHSMIRTSDNTRIGTRTFTTPDRTSGWGTDFGVKIACGLSSCEGSVDRGTCNNFRVTASYPTGHPGGYFFRWAARYTDPGWSQFGENFTATRSSIEREVVISNDSTTFVRFNFQANRAPAPTVQNPGTINIPTESTVAAVGFIGHTTDPDGNRGQIQIMYRRTTDANWTSFGTNNNAEGPDGRRAAIANGVSAPNITEWGWSWNSNPVPVDKWVVNAAPIYFPNVNLTAGTYQVAARAIDEFNLYGSSWNIQSFTVNPPITTHTITYVGNDYTGGNPPPGTPASVNNGGTYTVLGNTGNFVRSGFEFTGWNRRSNGTGDHYQAGGTIANVTSNFNLYAIWRAISSTPSLSCTVTPTGGVVPLGVMVVPTTNLTSPLFSYDFDWDGNVFEAETVRIGTNGFYSYQVAGSYRIRVRAEGVSPAGVNTTLEAVCSPNPVEIRRPTGGDGGEVRP